MTSSFRERIAEINDVAGVLRLVASLEEVKEGAVRLASGATRGMLTFKKGYVTAAVVTSGAGAHAAEALKQMLALPDAAFQFISAEDAPAVGKNDEVCVDIKALLANKLSLEGIDTAVKSIPEAGGVEDDVETSAVPALDLQIPMPELDFPVIGDANETEEYKKPSLVDYNETQASEAALDSETGKPLSPKAEKIISMVEAVSLTAEVPALKLDGEGAAVVEEVAQVVSAAQVDQASAPLDEKIDIALETEQGIQAELKTEVKTEVEPEAEPEADKQAETGPLNLNELLKGLSEDDDKAEFEASDKVLEDDEVALTEEQRTLLEEISKLHDKEGFEEADPNLAEPELLTEAQLELLEKTPVAADGFHEETIGPELFEERALGEEQKALLEIVSQLSDKEAFEEADVKIQVDGSVLSDEERWMMEQNASILTPEQQKAEFEKAHGRLDLPDEDVKFKEFVEPAPIPADSEFEAGALDAIPAPKVLDGDFAPLKVVAEKPEIEKREDKGGIIGRVRGMVWGKLPQFERTERAEPFRPEKYAGPVILICLCVGLFTIPAQLKKAMSPNQKEDIAAEQMQLVVSDEMDHEIKYADDDPSYSHSSGASGSYHGQGSSSGGSGGTGSGGGEYGGGGNDGALSVARSLAAKGYTKRALQMYHEYFRQNRKGTFASHLELIQTLMNGKEFNLARTECVEAMTVPGITNDQLQQLWALYYKCMDLK